MSYTTTQSNVLWIDFDNGKDLTEERLAALAKARDLGPDIPLQYVSMPTPWLDSSNEIQMQELENTIVRVGAKLVIIDNLNYVSGKVEENSAEMGTVMANWRRLAEKLGIAIIIIHHQTKGNKNDARPGNSLRGHSSIEAALDLALQVERSGQSDIIDINPTKVRGADFPAFSARFTYTQAPGTIDLEKARFFGHETHDFNTGRSIETVILTVLRDHLERYAPPNKQALAVKVRDAIKNQTGLRAPAGLNKIRDTIEVMASEDKLSVSKGKHGAKLYDLPSRG
jgi:hypothetical protein